MTDRARCPACGAELSPNGLCTRCMLRIGMQQRNLHVRCPHCRNPIEMVDDTELSDVSCPSCGSSFSLVVDETIAHDAAGRTLGQFELIEQLGVGAFGSVWKAKDVALDRTVAVKIPRKDQLDAEETDKFFREARAAAQLRHPNVVSVHEVGRDNGQVYIVSDYVQGATLSEWTEKRKLSARECAELCAKIADALHHAHEAGVIHRDLKPSNIMMDLNGEPHVMDFGLAKREAGEITMTMEGKVIGTPAYMSPEQARGEGHEADRRSDVYSLGVVLFQLLTAELPFRGTPRLLLVQILKDEPPRPRNLNIGIPRDLETICLKCLQKDPPQRYQTAKDFGDELRRFLRGEPIQARRITAAARMGRWARRQPLAASTLSLLLLVAGLAAALTWQSLSNLPLRQSVSIATQPENAFVVFIPLDKETGVPYPDRASQARRSLRNTQLVPGDYLVVAYLDDDYFHEVYRRVPASPEDPIGVYDQLQWEFDEEGVVSLPPVKLHRSRDVTRNMAQLTGTDSFVMGSPQLSEAPAHLRRIPDFFLDLTEVTVGQLRDAQLPLPSALRTQDMPDDFPVTQLPYELAVTYAEALGKRLMQEDEYEYAATIGGTTEYPWGNAAEPSDNWIVGPVTAAEHDRVTIGGRTISGLFSNVAEWTGTWGVGYPRQKGLLIGVHGRVIRGGPARNETHTGGPRKRIIGVRAMRSERVGFRCARSVTPRLEVADFSRILLKGQ